MNDLKWSNYTIHVEILKFFGEAMAPKGISLNRNSESFFNEVFFFFFNKYNLKNQLKKFLEQLCKISTIFFKK
jgi:hypothetical protein